MDIRALILQIVGMQKASFDNGYAALITIQDEMGRLMNDFMDQSPWIPSESRGLLKEWLGFYSRGRDDFKKAVDDWYDQMGGSLLSSFDKVLRV